jgi:hypothetical protein
MDVDSFRAPVESDANMVLKILYKAPKPIGACGAGKMEAIVG